MKIKKTLQRYGKDNRLAILSFALCFLLGAVIFSLNQRMFFSKYTVMSSDFLAQYVPFYEHGLYKLFAENEIFTKAKFFYSADFSFGGDISASLAYFAFFSPFNIWYLLIENENLASILLVLSKISMAGYAFQYFSRIVLKQKGWHTCFFSLCYAFSAYIIVFQYNVNTLDGIYCLPFLMCCLYNFVTEKKTGGLCLMYAYIFVVNFYVGYMLGFFSLFAFLLYLFVFFEKDAKKIACLILRFAGCVLLAACLSCFVLVPSAYSVFTGVAEDRTSDVELGVNMLSVYADFFLGIYQGIDTNSPYIYSGLLSLLLLPLYFCDRAIPKKNRIYTAYLLAILLLSCVFEPLFLFWHAFDVPDGSWYRFSYMISFLVISMAVSEWDSLQKSDKNRYLIFAGAVNVGLYILLMQFEDNILDTEYQGLSLIGLEVNAFFLLAYVIILCLKKYLSFKLRYGIVTGLVVAELVINSLMTLSDANYAILEYKDFVDEITEQSDALYEELQAADDGVYRIWQKNILAPNYALGRNMMTAGMFSSFENSALREALHDLGYAMSPRVIFDYGATDATKMLFGVKYDLFNFGIIYDTQLEEPYYETSDLFLGLGYMVSGDVYDYTSSANSNVMANINTLLSEMTGEDISVFQKYEGSYTMEQNGVDVEFKEAEGGGQYFTVSLSEGCDSGYLNFVLDNEDYENLFVYHPSGVDGVSEHMRSFPVLISETGDQGSLLTTSQITVPHLISVGKNEDGKYMFQVCITSDMEYQSADIGTMYVCTQDTDELQKAYDALKGNTMEFSEFMDGYIKGTVTATEDKDTLFLSVPYDKNWVLKVDGVRTEITPVVEDAFISVQLTPGEHEIELEYKNPYVVYGVVLTVVGLLLFAAIYGRQMVPGRKKSGGQADGSKEGTLSLPGVDSNGDGLSETEGEKCRTDSFLDKPGSSSAEDRDASGMEGHKDVEKAENTSDGNHDSE